MLTILFSSCFFLTLNHPSFLCLFFFNDTATTEIYTLSLHDALPISDREGGIGHRQRQGQRRQHEGAGPRSEEHTSELQSHLNLVCRLLLEKKKRCRMRALRAANPPPATGRHRSISRAQHRDRLRRAP